MEFLPATAAALDEYLTLSEPDLGDTLTEMGASAALIIPELVGLSLSLFDEVLTFTMVATPVPIADLDSEIVDPGAPGPRAGTGATASATGPMDELRWLEQAQEGAAPGVSSSLSLPLLEQGRVVGGVSLYASTAEAFTHNHQPLADVLGASAACAVTNSDLGFATRGLAAEAPDRLRTQQLIDVAVGILAAREQLAVNVAREELARAAKRAGITEGQAARVLISVHNPG